MTIRSKTQGGVCQCVHTINEKRGGIEATDFELCLRAAAEEVVLLQHGQLMQVEEHATALLPFSCAFTADHGDKKTMSRYTYLIAKTNKKK